MTLASAVPPASVPVAHPALSPRRQEAFEQRLRRHRMLSDGAESRNVLGEKVRQGEPITGVPEGFFVAAEECWVDAEAVLLLRDTAHQVDIGVVVHLDRRAEMEVVVRRPGARPKRGSGESRTFPMLAGRAAAGCR